MYVPRDEAFEELKQGSFLGGRLRAVLHTLVPSIMASISSENADVSSKKKYVRRPGRVNVFASSFS